ncbi:unnamed protein product [Allacma fusca]|uniref:Uncharacterized protein n=1 Tax=Allacma fusca TaxID=39272 RepID=A0A8J2KXM4_9HEXA|nr:unnamed protein product [Allacma fusca]
MEGWLEPCECSSNRVKLLPSTPYTLLEQDDCGVASWAGSVEAGSCDNELTLDLRKRERVRSLFLNPRYTY